MPGTLSIPLRRAASTYGPLGSDDIVVLGVVDNSGGPAANEAVADVDNRSYIWFRQNFVGDQQDHHVYPDDPPQPPVYPADAVFTAARLLVAYTTNVDVQMTLITSWEHPAGVGWAEVEPTGFDLPQATADTVIDLSTLAGTVGDNRPFTPESLQITYPSGGGYVAASMGFEILGNVNYAGGGLTVAPSLPLSADVRIFTMTLEIDWVEAGVPPVTVVIDSVRQRQIPGAVRQRQVPGIVRQRQMPR